MTRTDTGSRLIAAPPAELYRALLDPDSLIAWLPPRGMTGRVLEFDPQIGGRYRIELIYEAAVPTGGTGKSTRHSDISRGRFLELVPDRRVVQSVRFETEDPAFAGEMVVTWSLEPAEGGTLVTVSAADVPAGISARDHEAGLASSLANLARFVE